MIIAIATIIVIIIIIIIKEKIRKSMFHDVRLSTFSLKQFFEIYCCPKKRHRYIYRK